MGVFLRVANDDRPTGMENSNMQPRSNANTLLHADDRLVTVRQAAAVLGVSVRTVHNLVAAGQLAKVKLGHMTRFRLSVLRGLMERGASTTRSTRRGRMTRGHSVVPRSR